MFAQIGQIYGDKLGDQERAIQYYESALTVDPRVPAGEPRAVRAATSRAASSSARCRSRVILTQKVTREGDPVERSRVLSQARRRRREDGRPARRRREPRRRARDSPRERRRARAARRALPAGARGVRLRRDLPRAREALPQARRRQLAGARARGAGLVCASASTRSSRPSRSTSRRCACARRVQRRRRDRRAARAPAPLRRGRRGSRGVHRARQDASQQVGGALSPGRDLRRRRDGSGAGRDHARGADRGGRGAPRGALPPGAGALPPRSLRARRIAAASG